MFYAIAEAGRLGFGFTPDEARDIARAAEMIKTAPRAQVRVTHPEEPWHQRGAHREDLRASVGAVCACAEHGDRLDW